MKVLNTVLALTALLGWLPPLICLLVIHFAIEHGAREWPDLVFDAVFIGLYFVLLGLGSYIYATWFKAN